MEAEPPSVWFRVADLVGFVRSADAELLAAFRNLYYEPAEPCERPGVSYHVHVDRRLSPTKRHSITKGPDFRQLLLVTAFYPSIFAALEHDIQQKVVATLRSDCLLRAGAVAAQGRGVLVAGDYESGRNHLVQALVERGCLYFGDSVAILRGPDLRLFPFPKSLGQRRAFNPLADFGREGAPFRERGKMTARFLPPPPPHLRPDASGQKVDVLLFPRPAEDASRPRLTPLSQGLAAARLAENLLRREDGLAGTFQDLVRLAAGARSFELEVASGKRTTDLLFERIFKSPDGDEASPTGTEASAC